MAVKKGAAKKSAVAKTTGSEVATSDFSEFADADGFENTDSDDFAIPILKCLQPQSPSILGKIPGHETGKVINTSTNEAFDGAGDGRLVFVPSTTTREILEWKPKNAGLVGRHAMDSAEWEKSQKEGNFPKFKRGDNDMVETFSVYGVAISPDGALTPCMIPFSSTGIKGYKHFMSRARAIQDKNATSGRMTPAPLFSRRYLLGVKEESNPDGTFYNFDITLFGGNKNEALLQTSDPEQHAIVQSAHGMIAMVNDGTLKVDHNKGGRDASSSQGDAEAPEL